MRKTTFNTAPMPLTAFAIGRFMNMMMGRCAGPVCSTKPYQIFPRRTACRPGGSWRAKKLLIYSLLRLELPFDASSGTTKPLSFDFVRNTTTGYADGLVTVDIMEADAVERERQRQFFHEPYRSTRRARRGGEWNVSLASYKAGGWIEPNPAGARQKDLRPRVQRRFLAPTTRQRLRSISQ